MRCPACSTPASETDPACRQCGFTLDMTDQAFGIPPIMNPPLADLAGVLSRGEIRTLRAAAVSLEQRFPQVSVCMVFVSAPPNAPLPIYAFWLFNRAALFSAVEKAGDNRGILLLIDVDRNDAVLMPGYGLEPFVSEAALRHCLEAAAPALHQERFADAAVTCLAELERQFTALCQTLPKIFGLNDDAHWFANLDQSDPALMAEGDRDDLY